MFASRRRSVLWPSSSWRFVACRSSLLPALLCALFASCGDDASPLDDSYADRVPRPSRYLAAGSLRYLVSNSGRATGGEFGQRLALSNHGPLLASDMGLWIGATVNGEARASATAFYTGDFAPDVTSATVLVYLLKPNDPTEIPDYERWPVDLGAPATPEGHPRVIGEQTTWTMYNDRDVNRHDAFHSPPLVATVSETAWVQPNFPSVLFIRYQVKNSSSVTWSGTTLGYWADADVSDQELVGTDVARDMVYTYVHPDGKENHVTGAEPALGVRFLKTPGNAGLTAAARQWKNLNEPDDAVEALRILNGVDIDGAAFIDSSSGRPTRYWAAGDPVARAGFFEKVGADRRMIGSTGPVDVSPGDSVELIVAIAYATGGDALQAVANLRLLADQVARNPEYWDIE